MNTDRSSADDEAFSHGREPWRSPVAQLPLWPLVLSGSVIFCFSAFGPDALFGSGTRAIVALFVYALPLGWWWASSRRRSHTLREVMGPWPTLRLLGFALAAMVATRVFRVGWLASLASLDLIPEHWKRGSAAPAATAHPWLELLVVFGLAPCLEEVVFRGILFRRFSRWMRPIVAALCSSLLFALLHSDSVGTFVSGLVLVALYVRTGSLWPPIASHALGNAAAGPVAALVDARSSLGWMIAGAQLVCVPWLVWFLYDSLRPRLSESMLAVRRELSLGTASPPSLTPSPPGAAAGAPLAADRAR